MLPLCVLLASGCAHTGAFQPPAVLPPGRVSLDLVGAGGPEQHSTRKGSNSSAFTLAEGRLSIGALEGAEVAGHVSPTGLGGSVRVMPFGRNVPVAIFAGGGQTHARVCYDGCDRIEGTSGFAGVSAGRPLPPSAALMPYVGIRYAGMDAVSSGDGGEVFYPQRQYVLALGIASTRSGPNLELSLYNGPPVVLAGGVRLHIRF